MERLPNTVKQALSKAQTPADLPQPTQDQRLPGPPAHPDAGLLTAFQEGAVTASERERLLAHLAVCQSCREVVRLATPSAEIPQQVFVPASGRARRLSWAAVLATTVVVGSVGIIYKAQLRVAQQTRVAATQQAAPAPDIATKQVAPVASPAPAAPAKKAALPPAPATDAIAKGTPALQPALKPQTAMPSAPLAGVTSPAPEANASSASAGVTEKAVPQPTPGPARMGSQAPQEVPPASAARYGAARPLPPANANAASADAPKTGADMTSSPAAALPEGGSREQARAQTMKSMAERKTLAARMAKKAASGGIAAAPARWRISANGELQRAVASGEWQIVLSPANVRFRSVAVVGENVWAGGTQASLFHSADSGTSWEQVKLPRGDSAAPTITSIKFEDALHGTVAADDGTTWITSDGGRSWALR